MNGYQTITERWLNDYYEATPAFAAALVEIAEAGKERNAQREQDAIRRAVTALESSEILRDVLATVLNPEPM